MNGGPNSGNHNPCQWRGVGKPNSKISFSENVKKKTNDYLDKAVYVEEDENADYSRLNVRTEKDGTLSLYRTGNVGDKDIESYAYNQDSSFLEDGDYSRYSRKDVENNGYEIFAGLCDGFYNNSSQQFNTYGEYEIVTIKKDLLK